MTHLPKAIVTGAPGWLGSRLVETLVAGLPDSPEIEYCRQRQVVVLVHDKKSLDSFGHLGDSIKAIHGDLTDRESLSGLFENAGGATVFHCAGIIHPLSGVSQFYRVNVEGTKNLLDCAGRAGAAKFIHVSSNSPVGVNADADSPFDENSPYNPYMGYGRSKKLAEDLVNEAGSKNGLKTVIIRPPWFYGPGQPPRQTLFFTMIRKGSVPLVGDGRNLRSMAYIDNICQGLMLCETKEEAAGQTYWIADATPYTMNEVLSTVEQVLEEDFNIKVAHRRIKLPGLASEIAYMMDGCLQSLGIYHQKIHVLSEMNKNIACSVEKAARELGYVPKVGLREGMHRSIDWVIKQGIEI